MKFAKGKNAERKSFAKGFTLAQELRAFALSSSMMESYLTENLNLISIILFYSW
jgi:hypothetical protein